MKEKKEKRKIGQRGAKEYKRERVWCFTHEFIDKFATGKIWLEQTQWRGPHVRAVWLCAQTLFHQPLRNMNVYRQRKL